MVATLTLKRMKSLVKGQLNTAHSAEFIVRFLAVANSSSRDSRPVKDCNSLYVGKLRDYNNYFKLLTFSFLLDWLDMKNGFPAYYFQDKNCLNFSMINNTRLLLHVQFYKVKTPDSRVTGSLSHCLRIDGVDEWSDGSLLSSDGGMS